MFPLANLKSEEATEDNKLKHHKNYPVLDIVRSACMVALITPCSSLCRPVSFGKFWLIF